MYFMWSSYAFSIWLPSCYRSVSWYSFIVMGTILWDDTLGRIKEFSGRFFTSLGLMTESLTTCSSSMNFSFCTLRGISWGVYLISICLVSSPYNYSANCLDSLCLVPQSCSTIFKVRIILLCCIELPAGLAGSPPLDAFSALTNLALLT